VVWEDGDREVPSYPIRLKVLRVWRVVYQIEGPKVRVILIGHRKDCYARLRRRM